MTPKMKSGFGLGAAAAVIALSSMATVTTPALAKSHAALVHCYGVNTCKGTSDCKSYGHECKGQNECKGQGFKAETKSACTADGGKLTEN